MLLKIIFLIIFLSGLGLIIWFGRKEAEKLRLKKGKKKLPYGGVLKDR